MADREIDITVRIRNETSEFHRQQRAQFNATTQAANKAAKQQATDSAKAARDSAKEWQRADAERLRDFKRIQAERTREQRRSEASEKRSANEMTRAWVRAGNEQIRDFRRVQAEKNKASRDAEREAKRSAAAQAKAYREAQSAISGSGSMLTSLKQLAAGYIGVSLAAKGLEFLNTSWEAYNQSIKTGVADLKQYRQEVLELAALKDRLGNTTAETRDQLIFRSKTLQSRQDAVQFQKAAVGGGSAFIDKPGAPGVVSEAEYNKYLQFAGSYQASRGESAESHGSLAGVLPGLLKSKNQTGDQLSQRHNQITKLLDPGRFSSVGSGIDQFLSLSPLISSGLFGSGDDAAARAAAMTSTLSISYKDRAGDAMQQLTRATVGGIGKNKAPKLSDDDDKMKIGAYLSSIGVEKTMTPDQIANLIAGDVDVQENKAKAEGREFTEFDYLQHMGYGAQEERNVLMDWRGRRNVYRDKMTPMIQKAPDLEASKQEIRGYQASDPLAQSRAVDLSGDLANASIAAGPNEIYTKMRELAFNQLKAENPRYYSGTFDEWDKNGVWNAPFKKDVINRASEMMTSEANRVGAYVPQGREFSNGGLAAPTLEAANPLDYGFAESSTSRGDQEEQYYKYFQAISEKGGNPILSAVKQLTAVAEKQLNRAERSEKAIVEAIKPKAPQPKPNAGNVGRVQP